MFWSLLAHRFHPTSADRAATVISGAPFSRSPSPAAKRRHSSGFGVDAVRAIAVDTGGAIARSKGPVGSEVVVNPACPPLRDDGGGGDHDDDRAFPAEPQQPTPPHQWARPM
jgi:hypothetical protein